jgi:hypothetical protein
VEPPGEHAEQLAELAEEDDSAPMSGSDATRGEAGAGMSLEWPPEVGAPPEQGEIELTQRDSLWIE